MIIQSLIKYYEALSKQDKISAFGFGMANVAYAAELSPEGKLLGLMPLKVTELRGKKEVVVPRRMEVPQQKVKAAGITSNFLCDSAVYIFGIDTKGKPERAQKCFEACAAEHKKILSGVDSVCAKAVLGFFESFDAKNAAENPLFIEAMPELLTGANIVFFADGIFVQEDPEIKRAWSERGGEESEEELICLATGRHAPYARLHQKFTGFPGAQASGASLVCFNDRADESYGRESEQGKNAPMSEYATFAYGTALKSLLKDRNHYKKFSDSMVLYWAENGEERYADIMSATLDPSDDDADKLLSDLFSSIRDGNMIDTLELDPNMRFNILALAPNAGRISVRFFYQNTFGKILDNMRCHYERLEIIKAPFEKKYLSPYFLLREISNLKSKDKSAPAVIAGGVLRSILENTPYPAALFSTVLLRIKAEQDSEDGRSKKITSGRAAIIKAYLLKNVQNDKFKGALKVSLDRECKYLPYVYGRIFAKLEEIQYAANPNINATIKDRYFNAACATPENVFSTLNKLESSHIRVLRRERPGYAVNLEKQLGDLYDLVDETVLPKTFTLGEQGSFILGYYHETQARYNKIKEEK